MYVGLCPKWHELYTTKNIYYVYITYFIPLDYELDKGIASKIWQFPEYNDVFSLL